MTKEQKRPHSILLSMKMLPAVVSFTCMLGLVHSVIPAYLGCYGKYTTYTGSGYKKQYTKDFKACVASCPNDQSAFVRGNECICYSSTEELTRINEKYCQIKKGGNNAGGNLGGSVYSNNGYMNDVIDPRFENSFVFVPWWYIREVRLTCSLMVVEPATPPYCTYFPNNNPGECVAFCNHIQAKFAVLGYQSVTFDSDPLPVCKCVNTLSEIPISKYEDGKITPCPGDGSAQCGVNGVSGSAYYVSKLSNDGEGPTLHCDHGPCGSDGCHREGVCYKLKSLELAKMESPQTKADTECNTIAPSGVLSLDTKEEQDFIITSFTNYLEQLGNPDILTSGYASNCKSRQFKWGGLGGKSQPVHKDVLDIFYTADDPDGEECFIWLKPTVSRWRASLYPSQSRVYYICEFSCKCHVTGDFEEYIQYVDQPEKEFKSPGTNEIMKTVCKKNPTGCDFEPKMPDSFKFKSQWIDVSLSQIDDGFNASKILQVAMNETASGNYTGHEIGKILELVKRSGALQNNQSANSTYRLQLQEMTTRKSFTILNNLVKKGDRWEQLNNEVTITRVSVSIL